MRKGGTNMNEVFLEGTVASMTFVEHAASARQHCVCQLRVVHRNQKQQTVNELYTINAWNRLAVWAAQALKPGMRVCVKGYLTQRTQQNVVVTEVTANRFVIQQATPPLPNAVPAQASIPEIA